MAFGLKGYLEHPSAAAELDTHTEPVLPPVCWPVGEINLPKSSPGKQVLVLVGLWPWGTSCMASMGEGDQHPWLAPTSVLQKLGHRSGKRRYSQTQVQGSSFVFRQPVPVPLSQPGSVLFIPRSTAAPWRRKAWWKS